MSEDRPRVHPFEMGEQFVLLDRVHEYQRSVESLKSFVEGEFKYLRERIDHGISPTMQTVKTQNEELEKTIIRLEGDFKLFKQSFQKQLDDNNEFIGDLKDGFRKIVVATIIMVITEGFGSWVYLQKIKNDLQPMHLELKHKPRLDE